MQNQLERLTLSLGDNRAKELGPGSTRKIVLTERTAALANEGTIPLSHLALIRGVVVPPGKKQ